MVTDEQVRLLMSLLTQGIAQVTAAAKAGMSERTARKYRRSGRSPSQEKVVHTWRTRPDPFKEAWPEIETLLRQDGGLQATNIGGHPIIEKWRERLSDISWFMRCLNEHVARRANIEDNCKGRFWEGRFQSQALLDEAGLLTAMAYVDLNPIRAGIAASPEESDFTSIYGRIEELKRSSSAERDAGAGARVPLMNFESPQQPSGTTISFDLRSYLELVDWTGRRVVEGKRGSIDKNIPPILQRLNIDARAWERVMQPHSNVFGRALGRVARMRSHAQTLRQCWIRGLTWAQRLYGT